MVFRDFAVEEKTEDDVGVCAMWRDPGLPQPRKQPDGSKVRSYSGEWLFKDDNSKCIYAPLKEVPDLFIRFASLASRDPGTRDGRYEIMLDWIKEYGVLGLVSESPTQDGWSERREYLSVFWNQVRRAARCMELYEAATGPTRILKRSGVPGKTLEEKRKSAAQNLADEVQHTLRRHCFPKLYQLELKETGEPTGFFLSWGFRSLLGAMYLQMAWRIKTRQCEAPGCNNVIGLHKRSDMIVCSKRCAQRRRDHRRKAGTV